MFPALVDPFTGRKMASLVKQAGLADIAVHFEADQRRRNWVDQFTAARPLCRFSAARLAVRMDP